MNVYVVLHSESGHTALIARSICAILRAKGHEAEVELLRTTGPVSPSSKKIVFRRLPDVSAADVVIVGGPTWAFSASPVTVAFLRELDTLKGKKALGFVTHGLPFKWAGANRAVKKITSKLDALGAEVLPGDSLCYGFGTKQKQIDEFAEKVVAALAA